MERTNGQAKDQIAFVALTGFAAVMYMVPGEWISGLAMFRLALVTSALAAGLMVIRRVGSMEPISIDGVRGIGLICFTVLALASITWAVNPAVAQFTAVELLKLTAIYVTMINVITTPKRLVAVVAACALASIVTSVGVTQWYFAGEDLVEGYRARWVGVYADPNHMAMDLGMIVPLAVAMLAYKHNPWLLRLACAVAAVMAVVAIVLSHSRGGFIGLSVAMAVWAFREKRRLQALTLGGVFVVALLVFAPESFWKRNSTVTDFERDASAMGRVYAWKVTSEISSDRPLLGVGAGGFRYAWPLYAPPEARRAYVAHNVFLDVIGELGFLGLLFFLIFTGGAVAGAFEASRHRNLGWLGRGIAAAVVGYLVCDLFSGYMLSAHFYVLLGLAACAQRIAKQTSEDPVIVLRRDPVPVQALPAPVEV